MADPVMFIPITAFDPVAAAAIKLPTRLLESVIAVEVVALVIVIPATTEPATVPFKS